MKTSSDFLTSGKSIPAWITGLAFISTNLGALEVIGMGASGAKYGITTCHFYWVGAIPAMVFLGVFMMPFYYGSKARSVPEYLKLRFNEKTRGFNAFSFAIMTIFASGISMFAMAKLMQILLGWDFNVSILASAIIVLVYTGLGGLTSAIYNEVLQFFLIVAGFIPLVFLALKSAGGWAGVKHNLQIVATSHNPPYAADAGPEAGRTWARHRKSHGSRMVRAGHGIGLRALLRLLVHELPRGTAGHGGQVDVGGAKHPAHRRHSQDVHPAARDPARHDRHCADLAAGFRVFHHRRRRQSGLQQYDSP